MLFGILFSSYTVKKLLFFMLTFMSYVSFRLGLIFVMIGAKLWLPLVLFFYYVSNGLATLI